MDHFFKKSIKSKLNVHKRLLKQSFLTVIRLIESKRVNQSQR